MRGMEMGTYSREVPKFHADPHHLPRCPYRTDMRPWVQRLRQIMVNKKICLESVPGVLHVSDRSQPQETETKRRVVVLGHSLLRGLGALFVNQTHPTGKSAAFWGPRYGISAGDSPN